MMRLAAIACLLSLAAAPSPRIDGFQNAGPLLGHADPIPPPPMKVRWTFKADDVERAGIEASPAISGETAYIADKLGKLHALDLKTGKPRWTYPTPAGGFAVTPLIIGNKVFIGDLDGIFHCISADDGKKLWTIDAESPIHSSANASGNRIVFGTDGADILCVSADEPKILWRAKAGDRINAAPSIANGLAFVSGCDSQLRAYDLQTGQEKFAVDFGALAPGSAAIATDRIIVGIDGGQVLAYSLDGSKKLWTYDKVAESATVYSSPAIADGIAVIGARDRQFHAIDLATGQQKWAFKTRGDCDGSPMISAGRVYACSKDKRLYILDLKTGRELWSFAATRGIEAGPAIASGVVVFGDSSGTVFCLEQK